MSKDVFFKAAGQVWYVRGDEDNVLFETKDDAEIYTREMFPNETQEQRYGRIWYHDVWSVK